MNGVTCAASCEAAWLCCELVTPQIVAPSSATVMVLGKGQCWDLGGGVDVTGVSSGQRQNSSLRASRWQQCWLLPVRAVCLNAFCVKPVVEPASQRLPWSAWALLPAEVCYHSSQGCLNKPEAGDWT